MLAPVWFKRSCCKNHKLSYLRALWGLSLPLALLASPVAAQMLDNLKPSKQELITSEPLKAAGVAIAQQPSEESEPIPRFGCRQCVQPEYPESAREAQVEGNPQIQFEVNQHGDVIDAIIGQSSGNAALDQAALEAVMQSKFIPGGQGRAYTIEFDFSIYNPNESLDEPS